MSLLFHFAIDTFGRRDWENVPCIIHCASKLERWHNLATRLQYHLPFYLQYLARWPEYCMMAEGPSRAAMGYILGKVEGKGTGWHGHVTAVTVAPEFRYSMLALAQ